MEHDQTAEIAEQQDDHVIIPVAPSRDAGFAGMPIIIDLRATGGDDGSAANRDEHRDEPKTRQALQLVTVEDLQQTTRALRRENAELTALINAMRSDMQKELAERDRQLADVRNSSNETVSRAESQLAAAHMQISFSGDSDCQVLDIHEQRNETHAADLACATNDIEQLTQQYTAAVDERDLALAARDEMVEVRDRAMADRDALLAERDALRDAEAARPAAIQTERDETNELLAALCTERDEASELIFALHTERDETRAEIAALRTERNEARAQLVELQTKHDDTELQATTELHTALAMRDNEQAIALHERDVHLAALSTQLDQTRSELTRAHESLATLTAQQNGRNAQELSDELAATQEQLRTIETDLDERVQRAFEAGSMLGERAAERLARLLPAEAN